MTSGLPEQFGSYTLLDRIGYGGMAEVFLANTNSVAGYEKLLAIKRLLPHCVADEQTVDLLADEARITVQLSHPNIVQVFDFGRVGDSYYLAMEYVDGLDLKSLVQIEEDGERQRVLPLDVALHVTICILDGLDFAHNCKDEQGRSLGIIHRDVSPHNALISRAGEVKLTDFGVARASISSHVSVVGDIRGKFSYMPPEQACGGEIDQRVDLFAAGAILYELISGRQPFRSASSGQQMLLLNRFTDPPSKHAPDLPPELDQIALKALRNDPAERFATARAFADALREQLARFGRAREAPQQRLARLVEKRLRHTDSHAVDGVRMRSLDEYDHTQGYSLIADVDEESHATIVQRRGPERSDRVGRGAAETGAERDNLSASGALFVESGTDFSQTTKIMRPKTPGPEQNQDDSVPLAYAATDVVLELPPPAEEPSDPLGQSPRRGGRLRDDPTQLDSTFVEKEFEAAATQVTSVGPDGDAERARERYEREIAGSVRAQAMGAPTDPDGRPSLAPELFDTDPIPRRATASGEVAVEEAEDVELGALAERISGSVELSDLGPPPDRHATIVDPQPAGAFVERARREAEQSAAGDGDPGLAEERPSGGLAWAVLLAAAAIGALLAIVVGLYL